MAVKATSIGRLAVRRLSALALRFVGNILANDSVTLNTGANIVCGSALALVGSVTLDTSQDSVGCASTESSSPEPSTALMLLLIGGSALLWLRKPPSVRE
jgi:hypothetical protein